MPVSSSVHGASHHGDTADDIQRAADRNRCRESTRCAIRREAESNARPSTRVQPEDGTTGNLPTGLLDRRTRRETSRASAEAGLSRPQRDITL